MIERLQKTALSVTFIYLHLDFFWKKMFSDAYSSCWYTFSVFQDFLTFLSVLLNILTLKCKAAFRRKVISSFLPPHDFQSERLRWGSNDSCFIIPVSSLVSRNNELLYCLACPNPPLESLRQNSGPTLSSAQNLKPIIFEMTSKCRKFNFVCLKVKLNCITNGIWSIITLKCYWLCIQPEI